MAATLKEVAPGVTLIHSWIYTTWIIHDGGDGQPLVCDIGLVSHAHVVRDWLAQQGHQTAAIVATHGHVDHVGGLHAVDWDHGHQLSMHTRFADFETDDPPVTPRSRDVRKIARTFGWNWQQQFATTVEIVRRSRGGEVFGRFTPLQNPVHNWLGEGDAVPGASRWRLLQTYGHTGDSVSYYSETDGLLLTGDACVSLKDRLWFNPEAALEDEQEKTQTRLRELNVELVLPGHGPPIPGANSLIDARDWDEPSALKRLFHRSHP